MAEERRRIILLSEDKKRALTASKLNAEAKVANERLKKRKLELANLETVMETKYAIKQYSLEQLGKGGRNGGGVVAKKRRWEVLDRLARLGQGLSAGQRSDFSWFKEAWDANMLQQYGENGLKCLLGGCSNSWGSTRRGLGMRFPFSFMTKREDVSMGCQFCEFHKYVMTAMAEMGPGHGAIITSIGCAHPSFIWARAAGQGGEGLWPAVAACSCWPQLRLAAGVASCDARGMIGHAVVSCDARGLIARS